MGELPPKLDYATPPRKRVPDWVVLVIICTIITLAVACFVNSFLLDLGK